MNKRELRRYQKAKLPVLLSRPDTKITVTVWCPHCCATHVHSKEEGHRVAHCSDDTSLLFKKGYVLADAATTKDLV